MKSFTLTGEVTARHLSEGIRKNPRICPLAMALQELLAPKGSYFVHVIVGNRLAYIVHYGLVITHKASLGYELADNVAKIDYGRTVEPFTFSVLFNSLDKD